MGCCEKQAVETAVFLLGERADHLAPTRTRRDLPVDLSSCAGDVPAGKFPLLPPCPLRCPESRRSRPHYAPPTGLSGARALAGRSGPGDRWRFGWGERIGGSLTLTAYVRRSAASSEPDGTRGIRLSN